ncbi:class II SORL domain-containing protein, partial [Candidatus Woesearchaeota archaeon]|nr:class II SORL domain-containing protein [Candidatus Woesearchaeota archaeon]
MNDLMKKHVPVITVVKQDPLTVEVHVGKLLKHPNEAEHYIGWIELYSEDKLLAKADLTPVSTEPVITFVLNEKVQKLRALEWCNVHGV